MKIRLVRASKAPVRVIPLAEGERSPKPRRAAVAGFAGRPGQTCDLVTKARRLLFVGLGAGCHGAEAAGALAAARLGSCSHVAIDARGRPAEIAASLAAGFALRAWRWPGLHTAPNPESPGLDRLDVLVNDPASARPAWRRSQAAVEGAIFARELVTEPSGTLTPAAFVERLRDMDEHGVTLEVLGPDELREQRFGALLAVGAGSAHPPCVAVLRWPGRHDVPPVAFVGKGITFDTGGVCIKPAEKMWEMRGDMAGAAACAGAILALARRRSPTPAVAVLALAENATGAASYRPGDVLRTVPGTTVEVVDTDAEGRLVLADALAWTIARYRPQAVIDVATLTGSIVTALGTHMAGLFDNDAALASHVAAAGAAVDEPVWRMPIGDSHRKDLDSEIADLRNCLTGRLVPDACHAAAFLREFVGQTPWVHLDIAGVESRETADDRHAKGATGFGVRLLDRMAAARFETAL